LLAALGGEALEVEHHAGWAKRFAADLRLPIGNGQQSTSSATFASGQREVCSEVLFPGTMERPRQPSIPFELVWFAHEALWQEVTDLRMNYSLSDFVLKVEYHEDFGVNTELKTAILGKGPHEVGGSFVSMRDTEWSLRGKFSAIKGRRCGLPLEPTPAPPAGAQSFGGRLTQTLPTGALWSRERAWDRGPLSDGCRSQPPRDRHGTLETPASTVGAASCRHDLDIPSPGPLCRIASLARLDGKPPITPMTETTSSRCVGGAI
jgi:hypothetical protein